MFCKNCGTEIEDSAMFCYNCGAKRIKGKMESNINIDDNSIIFKVMPKFNFKYKFLSSISQITIALLLLYCSASPTLLLLLFKSYSLLLITLGIIALYVIVKMLIEKKQYDALEYNFYNTKVEYKDGFINKESKEVKYRYIRETMMTQNVLERICGLGTIKLFTNATNGGNNRNNHRGINNRNGIYIHCLENVKEDYARIKQIIDDDISDNRIG